MEAQHNETLRRASERHCEKPESATDIVWMRRQPVTTSRKEDRLTLLVVRAGLRAGNALAAATADRHSSRKTMTIRTQLKAGKLTANHNDALQVRTALKAGGNWANHNDTLRVRSTLKAGGLTENHNEALESPFDAASRRLVE